MTTGGGDEGDDISAATREAADKARRRAAQEVPTAGELADMTMNAGRVPDMSPAEIRRLAADAIEQARQISFLLGRLAELVDDTEPGP